MTEMRSRRAAMRAQTKRGLVARLICHLEGWAVPLSLVRVRSDPGSDFWRPNMANGVVDVGAGLPREIRKKLLW